MDAPTAQPAPGAASAATPPPVPPHRPFLGRTAVFTLAALAVVALLCVFSARRTSDAMASLPFLHLENRVSSQHLQGIVDQSPWSTAIGIAALAKTQEELAFAHQAERLADHDVDQAFAAALRAASLRQHTLTGDALALQKKVTDLEATVATDQDNVKQLTPKGGDDLAVAQAQLTLDQDELNDAREDLARATGDRRGEIQQELVAREAEVKKFDAASATGEGAVTVARSYRTLFRFLSAWHGQNERLLLLNEARAASQHLAAQLIAEHNLLEAAAHPAANAGEDTTTHLAGLKRLSLQKQLLSIDDDRIDTETQLAGVYTRWAAQVALQHRILEHLIALQLLYIALILVAAILIGALVEYIAERESLDRRRTHTLSRILRLSVQVIALLAILLVVFGPPQQLSTVIGLTTAGLTVAFQDFILAFVGWFLLMGRNGIGVGDAVEINSVTGQVVEIGLFRTTLLETGNWTANGHPTGRRVAFNNRFAISGQFFNFSTAGQWMWDEITVAAPSGQDPSGMIARVQQVVTQETGEDARLAEQEWRRSALQRGLSQFSADPDVNLRPNGSSLDLVVRYVTPATSRFERRNRLYQCILEALRQPPEPPPAPQPSA